MRRRLLGALIVAVVLTATVYLDMRVAELRRSREPVPMGAAGGGGSLGAGSSVKLVLTPEELREKEKRKRSRRRRRKRRRKAHRLKDALSGLPGPQADFWERALKGLRSARRDRKGKVRTRRVRSARKSFSSRRRAAARKGRRARGRARRSYRAKKPRRSAAERIRRKYRKARRRSSGRTARAARKRGARVRFDGRGSGSGGGSSGLPRFGGSGSSRFRITPWAKRRKEQAARKARTQKSRTPRISDWMGKGTLKPPTGKLKAPSFSYLKELFPETLPDGKPYSRKTPPPSHIERLKTPEDHPKYERWLELDEHRGRGDEPHWHIDKENVPFLHAGRAWGRCDDGRWTWMIKYYRRWWTVADGAQRMVRHKDHWWWKTQDGWFLLHQGEPWVWRRFAEWRRDGFLQPNSGVRIVYSADGSRVAVHTPGKWTDVFDARTGVFIARFPE